MNTVAVLTAKPDLEIYREMEAAGAELGTRVVTIDALGTVALDRAPHLRLHGEAIATDDICAVMPRVGNWRPESVLAVLDAFRRAGVPSINGPDAIRTGRDHWLTTCALGVAGFPHPETIAGAEPERLVAAASARLGFPCVVKQRHSRQGVGVIRCASASELEAVLDSLWRVGDEVVVQRFCPPGGVSLRVLVLAGEVLGVTEHRAAAGEFRSNAARGGSVRPVGADAATHDLAVGATSVVGLGFAGVDLIPDGERWVVAEVNPSPGWRHFAQATGVSVARSLVAALTRLGRDR